MLCVLKILSVTSLSLLVTALPAADPNDDDFRCLSSWHAYDASEPIYTTEVTSEYVYATNIIDTDVPLSTLCDGRPRGEYTESRSTETYDPPITRTYVQDGLAPTCTIAETACTPILSSYSSSLSEYITSASPSPGDPHCTTYVPCSLNPDYCFIYAGAGKTLYYWPVTTVSGDFCKQDGSTVFAEPTSPPKPDTAVVDGYTFTSPTPYLSWENAFAQLHGRRPSRTQCGPPEHTDIVVPITAESFKSAGYGGDSTYSFNFADLNTIPADAYDRQRQCRFEGRCDIIVQEDYTVIVPLPTEIVNLEEEWANNGCRGTADKYYLTPVALATPAPTSGSNLL
ncbi:hypothetical protein Q7P37_002732 [Cladosporium fusiforme]